MSTLNSGEDGGKEGEKEGEGQTVTFPENWKEGLPEELRSAASITAIQDIPSLAKSYVEAQKMVGKEKIVVPDEFATEDDWRSNVWGKLGLPEKAEEYKLDKPKDSPIEDQFVDELKKVAWESGVLPKQAAKLLEFFNEKSSSYLEDVKVKAKEEREAGLEALKKEYGEAFESRVTLAKRLIKEGADADKVEQWNKQLDETGLGDHPLFIDMLATMGKKLLSEDVIKGETGGKLGKTPEEAQIEANRILGDTTHPYWNKDHPSHGDAVRQMTKLMELAG
jgi:hypothetical protein